MEIKKILKNTYNKNKKSSLIIYVILRILIVLCLIIQIYETQWNNAFLCLLSLILLMMPRIVEDKLKIDFPTPLEIIIYLFIFASEILGEINNFYVTIPHWDTVLHTMNGFWTAAIGFSLIDLLNKNSKKLNLAPIFVAIVAFCFSMTIGVLWEFFEYGVDTILLKDMQKDKIVKTISSVELDETRSNKPIIIKNIKETQIITEDEIVTIDGGYLDIGKYDTMKDLIVNFIGATVFSIIGYLYIKNRDKYKFAENFIPTKVE